LRVSLETSHRWIGAKEGTLRQGLKRGAKGLQRCEEGLDIEGGKGRDGGLQPTGQTSCGLLNPLHHPREVVGVTP
jgi:hypothetical protein